MPLPYHVCALSAKMLNTNKSQKLSSAFAARHSKWPRPIFSPLHLFAYYISSHVSVLAICGRGVHWAVELCGAPSSSVIWLGCIEGAKEIWWAYSHHVAAARQLVGSIPALIPLILLGENSNCSPRFSQTITFSFLPFHFFFFSTPIFMSFHTIGRKCWSISVWSIGKAPLASSCVFRWRVNLRDLAQTSGV